MYIIRTDNIFIIIQSSKFKVVIRLSFIAHKYTHIYYNFFILKSFIFNYKPYKPYTYTRIHTKYVNFLNIIINKIKKIKEEAEQQQQLNKYAR